MARQRRLSPREVFLSHSAGDRPFVERLAETLAQHNVPVWYSATNIVGARQWHDEIGAALRRCDWFLVVLSPRSVKSRWVKRELLYALDENRYEGRIVPLLYRRCDYAGFSWTLRSLQMIDFTGSFATGCGELLKIWGRGYRPAENEE